MARPAVIIGLGGTGQWILTYLKKDLLEIGNGELPPGVRLLSFDTTKHASAVAGHDGRATQDPGEKRRKTAGAVELEDKTEFIHIGSNLNDLVGEIRDGKHQHLSWIDAKGFLRKLPEASLAADDGAGAIRHIGRLCLVKDVQSRAQSRIISTIENAMEHIANESSVTVQNRMEIHIVGSLAGGTGAGMLVDIPMLCRDIASEKFHGNIVVRGFIVTPRAFVAGAMGKGRDMLARSFAAWRELDRLLITSSEYGANQIKYSEHDASLILQSNRRLYDSTYLIDPQRQHNPLDPGSPEDGLFPAIANAISAMLDEEAGREYSEQVINLSDTYAKLPLMPTHSAVASYTMKVPVYYAQQKFTHELSKEVLDILLAPQFNDQGRVVSLSDTKNAEVSQDKVGINAALDFLNADTVRYDQEDIPNTSLLKLVAKIRNHKAQDDGKILTAVARGGLARRNAEFMHALVDIQQSEQGEAIVENITKELSFRVWNSVTPSRDYGDTPSEAFGRIERGVERVRIEHYGIEKADERLRGSFGDELEEAKLAQLRMYGALLRAWTEKTLNGESVNPRMARGGKLGYVRSFYKNLLDVFTYFEGFISKVNIKRNEELHVEEKAAKLTTNALQTYNGKKDKSCWLTFWDNFVHPEAHQAQRNYLQASQRDIEVLKDKILLAVIEETVGEFKEITQQTYEEIEQWVVHLATGEVRTTERSDGSLDDRVIRSLYHAIQEELDNIEVNHALDKGLEKVNQVVGEHTYQSDPSFVEDRLSHIKWQVSRDEESIPRADGSLITRVRGLKLHCLTTDPSENRLVNKGEDAISENKPIFILLTEKPYASVLQDHPFAREVMQSQFNSGEALADHVHEKAGPFYRKTATGVGPMHDKPRSAIIRVQSNIDADTEQYYAQFENKLNELDPSLTIKLVDSDDSYKQTIVRFDDVIKSHDFDIWERCRDAYLSLVTDVSRDRNPADLHVFEPEINACKYEKRISETLRKDYRTLHPDVVALLEDDQRIEMFFRALALGLIQPKKATGGQEYWVYPNSSGDEIQLTIPEVGFGGGDEKHFFHLINQFAVRGEDIRDGYKQTGWIDFEKLEKAILDKHEELGANKVSALYKNEPERQDGMVRQMWSHIDRERAKIKDPQAKRLVAADLEDLAYLAKTIYLEAAQDG